LSAAQQRLARAKRRSRNRDRRREAVAARHRKIANQRKDFHHRTARELVERYDFVVVEDLQITNMLRRAKPVPDPDNPGQYLANGARAKSGLNRSMSDASWAQFVSILRAKAEEAGRTWIEVDPRPTSDRCEACGHAAREDRVSQPEFVCRACGHGPTQADEHDARNLLRAGLALHFTRKPREKKPAASSRRRSHERGWCTKEVERCPLRRAWASSHRGRPGAGEFAMVEYPLEHRRHQEGGRHSVLLHQSSHSPAPNRCWTTWVLPEYRFPSIPIAPPT